MDTMWRVVVFNGEAHSSLGACVAPDGHMIKTAPVTKPSAIDAEETHPDDEIFDDASGVTADSSEDDSARGVGPRGTGPSKGAAAIEPRSDVSDAQRQPGLEEPQGGAWAMLDREYLFKLITEQIPRFKSRPYVADERALRFALRSGLAHRLLGDFCWSLSFAPRFIRRLCFEGFLPICCELGGGSGLFVLLPKLHAQRCVLSFEQLHVPRKVRQRAKQFRLTVNRAFDLVLDGCIAQHGESWIFPPLQRALRALAASCDLRPSERRAGSVTTATDPVGGRGVPTKGASLREGLEPALQPGRGRVWEGTDRQRQGSEGDAWEGMDEVDLELKAVRLTSFELWLVSGARAIMDAGRWFGWGDDDVE